MIFSRRALFFSQKVEDPFSVVSERQHSVVKNWQLIGGPLAATIVPWYNRTRDNPALLTLVIVTGTLSC